MSVFLKHKSPEKLHGWSLPVCRSAELLSEFNHTLKTEMFDVAYIEREHSAYRLSLPLCTSDSPATHDAVNV